MTAAPVKPLASVKPAVQAKPAPTPAPAAKPAVTTAPVAPTTPVAPKPASVVTAKPVMAAAGAKTTTNTAPAGTVPARGGVIPSSAPAFQIKTREDRDAARYLKLLIYSDYGVGKTFLAGTASAVPSMQDVLFISAESGELTLDSDDPVFGPHFKHIDSITVQDYKTMAKIYEFLKLHSKYRDDLSPEGTTKLTQLAAKYQIGETGNGKPRRYKTIAIDSLSEIEAYCMNQLLGIDGSTTLDEEVAGAEWAEYKKQHGMIARLVRSFRDLPMHVVFICSRSFIQDESKKMLFSPGLTGKLSGQVQGFMDIVGYYVLGAVKEDGTAPRRLYVQPSGKFAAKSRFSSFKGAYFDDPTMGSILQKVGLLKA